MTQEVPEVPPENYTNTTDERAKTIFSSRLQEMENELENTHSDLRKRKLIEKIEELEWVIEVLN